MPNRSLFVAVSACFVGCLSACTTITPVTSLGGGKYMVGYQRKGGFDNWTEVKAGAITQANDYCAKDGKTAEILNTEEQGARGWTPMNVEVTFVCR